MKLEDICVSKDIAVELKESGFEQESIFIWRFDVVAENYFLEQTTNEYYNTDASAPTSSEMLVKLPDRIKVKNNFYWLHITKLADGKYHVMYRTAYIITEDFEINNNDVLVVECNEKFEDILAKMWLYLKKENLIK